MCLMSLLKSLVGFFFLVGLSAYSTPQYIEKPYESKKHFHEGDKLIGIIYFSENKSSLNGAGFQELSRIAGTLVSDSMRFHSRIKIIGFADTSGSESRNLTLGMKRAENVADSLKKLGVRMDNAAIASYGESISDPTRKSRRAEVWLVAKDNNPFIWILVVSGTIIVIIAVLTFAFLFSPSRRTRF